MSSVTPLSLGQRLVRERLRLHWSQEEVAQAIGTTARSINRWEHDKAIPHPHYRQQLCQLFHVSTESLFGPLSRGENSSSTSLSLWNVPFRRNPFFTGREAILLKLYTLFHSQEAVCLTHALVISGLGGIGKTQTAVEYAYRYSDHYSAVFWVRAETHALIVTDYVAMAARLNLVEKDEQDQLRIVEAVKFWLNDHDDWLLIVDNLEDFTFVGDFIPPQIKGYLIVTTRTQSTGSLASHILLEEMSPDEGILFLIRRAKRVEPSLALEEIPEALRVPAETLYHQLGGLPLALEQAASYMEETGCGLSAYLERYQKQNVALLNLRGQDGYDHPHSVVDTFSLSFQRIGHINPSAFDLLRLCAFFHPDAISEEMLRDGCNVLPSDLRFIAKNLLLFDSLVASLRAHSLIQRNPDTKVLTIHRLVQVVLRETMDEQTQRQWVEQAVRVVNHVFPEGDEASTWPSCQYLLPHAQACAENIAQWKMLSQEAGQLLHRVGVYLRERGQYTQSEHYLLQSQKIRMQTVGRTHPQVAQSLNELALLHFEQGRYDEAEALLLQCLTISEQQLGPEHLDVAKYLNNLAIIYRNHGRHNEVEPLLKRALAIREQQLGPCHCHTAQCLNNLGALYQAQKRYEEAQPLYEQALVVWEQVLGPNSPETAIGLNNLGRLFYLQGKYQDAQPLLQQALVIREQQLGPHHPATAQSLTNLGTLYRIQERYREAESLLQRALVIREQQLGSEHPDVAVSLYHVGRLFLDQGRHDGLEMIFQRALGILEKTLGPEHPDIIPVLESYLLLLTKTQGENELDELRHRLKEVQTKNTS